MSNPEMLYLLADLARENPRRNTEGLWDYLDRLCVLAGLLKPGEGRLPADYAFEGTERAVKPMEVSVRLPYKDPE